MSNPILSGINSVFQGQDPQKTGGIGSFDLSDDRFSNILDGKLDELQPDENTEINTIMDKLGVPAGLNIEGFDYNSIASELVNSTEKVDAIGTESNIRDDNKFDAGSLIRDAAEAFSPVVNSIINSEFSLSSDSASNPLNAVKNFWGNQASNFYSVMNKDTVNDITDLVSKL